MFRVISVLISRNIVLICTDLFWIKNFAALNEDAVVDFEVHMAGRDNDDIDNEIYDTNEGDVGFGSPNLHNMEESTELLTEDPGIEVEHDAHDKVKQLKNDYIGKCSIISYHYSFVNFLFYIYKFEKYLMHKSWIKILGT